MTTVQTALAQHISGYAFTLARDEGIADRLVSELMGSEHVASVEVSRVTPSCWKIDVFGWDDECLLAVCVTPRRVSVVTQAEREQWESLPRRYADAIGRNLALMSGGS